MMKSTMIFAMIRATEIFLSTNKSNENIFYVTIHAVIYEREDLKMLCVLPMITSATYYKIVP